MSELSDFRITKDKLFGHDQQSPLTPDQRKKFAGLSYYPENPGLAFAVEFAEEAKEGTPATLVECRGLDSEELFLPLMDGTSGSATYSGGRYLDLIELSDGLTLVDFNYAYNPYCAYNPHWSCPIPPPENRLAVPIEVGEKAFPGAIGHL